MAEVGWEYGRDEDRRDQKCQWRFAAWTYPIPQPSRYIVVKRSAVQREYWISFHSAHALVGAVGPFDTLSTAKAAYLLL